VKHMTEKLVKRLEAEGQRIVVSTSENLGREKERAIQTMEAKIKELTEALQIQPLKGAAEVIELLEHGGIIKADTVEVEWNDSRVELQVGTRLLFWDSFNEIKLNEGKYRVTLIIEPVED